MIARLSGDISSFLVARRIVPGEDREVYAYSFEILLSTLQSFIALALLSIVIGAVVETMLFLAGFVPLRMIAGGYHARTHFRCFLILMFVYAAFVLALLFLPASLMLSTIMASYLFSAVLVFIIAPSEDSNKPITREETKRFKLKSRIAVACYALPVGVLAVFVDDRKIALSLALGVLTVGLSLFANTIKGRKLTGMNKAVRGEEVEQ